MIQEFYEENDAELELSLDKCYLFGDDIKIIKHRKLNIVIKIEHCCWLVLNDIELSIFDELRSETSIQETLSVFANNQNDVINVITQIEAKQFEKPVTINNESHNIFIYLTNNCNQRCNHCYMFAGEINYEELPINVWKSFLLEFKNCGGKGVTFSGGEISVYNNYIDLLKYSKEQDLSVTILTNGVSLNNENIEEISQYVDEVQISLDGYDSPSYFKVRNHNGFESALNAINTFDALGTKVSVAVTPLYDDIELFVSEFEKFAKIFLVDHPNVFLKISSDLLNGRNIEKNDNNIKTYQKHIKKLIKTLYGNYEIDTFVINYLDNNIRNNCGFGEVCVAANGDVFWCNRIHELKSKTNITKTSYIEIEKKSRMIKKLTSVDNVLPCSKCEIKYICGGGCRMDYLNIKEFDESTNLQFYNFCDTNYKKRYLDKMIDSNSFFYSN